MNTLDDSFHLLSEFSFCLFCLSKIGRKLCLDAKNRNGSFKNKILQLHLSDALGMNVFIISPYIISFSFPLTHLTSCCGNIWRIQDKCPIIELYFFRFTLVAAFLLEILFGFLVEMHRMFEMKKGKRRLFFDHRTPWHFNRGVYALAPL